MPVPGLDQAMFTGEEPISIESTGRVLRRIRAKKLVTDILCGMSDQELMRKYELTPEGLRKLLIQHACLYKKSNTYRSIVDSIKSRRFPRLDVPMAIRCYNYRTSQKGFVRDISETGLRVAGIEAKSGESMTLFLPLQEIGNSEPVDFETVCRWSKLKRRRTSYSVSGFEITHISPEARSRLAELMELLRYKTVQAERIHDRRLDTLELLEKPRVLDPCTGPRQFSGELAGVDILDVVQFALLSGMKTVLVINSSEGAESRLYIDGRNIVHVCQADIDGEEAFFTCTALKTGKFSLRPWSEPAKQSVRSHADWLLIEAARRRDDAGMKD